MEDKEIKEIGIIKKKIDEYLKDKINDKKNQNIKNDFIEILYKIMNLYKLYISSLNQSDEILDAKNHIIEFLTNKGYNPVEFHILEENCFNEEKYITILMKNLSFYLQNYIFESKLLNLYYYQFHLIYFILTAILQSINQNILQENIIKFYFYHIVHFFQKDPKSPESYFIFYEGAFKLLKKKYNFKTNFILPLKNDFTISSTIQNMVYDIKIKLDNKKYSLFTDNELTFLGKFSEIFSPILIQINHINYKLRELIFTKADNDDDSFNLKILFTYISDCIGTVKNALERYNIKNEDLNKYYKYVNDFINLIDKYKLTYNYIVLMKLNNEQKEIIKDLPQLDIERYISYAKSYIEYNNITDNDYSEQFRDIINSVEFKNLYLSAMNSSYINDFVKIFGLRKEYNIFMKNYAKNINNYILYFPLSKGIKAYISNYFRIILNIHSIELIGEFNNEEKKNNIFMRKNNSFW